MSWEELKDFVTDLTVAKDALHIYVAFAIQMVAAAAFKKPLSSWIPWACVLAAELLNEFLDIALGSEPRVQSWQVFGAIHDIANTMLLPTLLLLLCRAAPQLFAPQAGSASGSESSSD